eukprot:m.15155 g.15155  ORF g.15155 m.15155 type:complete len:153 (+) comp4968_c0_seq1:394-852(+)
MPVKKWGVITDEATVNGTVEQTFDFLADFSTVARWDPGVSKASRLDDGEIKVGSRFSVTTVFNGKESDMIYEVTELERPNKIVLSGDGPLVKGIDTIVLSPATDKGDRTHVDYEASLTLKGFYRPFAVFLSSTYNKIGRDAMEGLEKTLNGQ